MKNLKEELRNDTRHLEWMDEVKQKEDEMNGLAIRKLHRGDGDGVSTKVDRAQETVVEGKMNLGVFWPCKVYEDIKNNRIAKPVHYAHNGVRLKGIILPQSEGTPIGAIELSEKSFERIRMIDQVTDNDANREERGRP